ncbi:hypothetical protein CYMTET_47427 [Cymbomonas tetramitiformis]|uniref:Corrinoid adenosyltransferase MMAB n=1 Tax=Cymbomonas tetramitiformis TaxID=36881 RepID=A0AAE0EWL3_9CHLO|nr:hypothetical protein CYMTET_47427 [Cymbomonas tetramitiformis]
MLMRRAQTRVISEVYKFQQLLCVNTLEIGRERFCNLAGTKQESEKLTGKNVDELHVSPLTKDLRVPKFKVYTKTGDQGTSSLYNGDRAAKDEAVFWALGDTDELNSSVGVAREFCLEANNDLVEQLEEIQSRLLDVGSAIATPAISTKSSFKLDRTRFDDTLPGKLEGWIDELDEHLPPLRNFILPSGGKAAAFLHVARTVCRRAERRVVPLVRSGAVEASVGIYLNRLSDYLFTAARYAAYKQNLPEMSYKKEVLKKQTAADG